MEELNAPPPVRRIVVDQEPTVVGPPASANGHAGGTLAPPVRRRHAHPAPSASAAERMATENLTIAYGDKEVVHGVTFDASAHEVLALIGPSGCGKTTLLRSLNRLVDLVGARVRA